ncbi:hypothetical protein BH09BAC4_BH09BAC4_26630 [soil metagenome]
MLIRLVILLLLLPLAVSAQTRRIDGLKHLLPTLQGRQRVKCLNALGGEFTFSFVQSDSALAYAQRAYEYAVTRSDRSGQAVSLLIQGDVQGRLLGNLALMERNSKQAIDLLKKEKDLQNLSLAYYKLAVAYNSQGKHERALAAADQAKKSALAAHDQHGVGWALEATGLIYGHTGQHWKCFENMIQSERIGRALNDSLLMAVSLAFIARSFSQVGDPQKALSYFHQSFRVATPFLLLWPLMEDMAKTYLQVGDYHSALYYQQKHRRNVDSLTTDPKVRQRFNGFLWGYSADIQLANKQYDQILTDVLPHLNESRRGEDVYPLMQSLLILGKVYQAKKHYPTALRFARELLPLASQTANKLFEKEGRQLMASLFEGLHKPDSAYRYYKGYIAINDSLETQRFTQRAALYLAESGAKNKIRLLKKDQQISRQQLALNKEELRKQSASKNILLGSLLTLLLFFGLVLRNNQLQRKNETLRHHQAQSSLKRKTLELEMQALRAQMNPHFIFNCLSAIDNLIQTSQTDKATSYLGQFAKLIRLVLESSKNNRVPFQKDFETLRLYLDMEQFRCNQKFSYSLQADQELVEGDYKIPPLIIQPFIENAIHHGLLNKPGNARLLEVSAHLQQDYIVFTIIDNGVGRRQAARLKELNRPGQQSYGIQITRERIQLHNRTNRSTDVEICDLEEGGRPMGTKAVVRINSHES